MPDPKFEGCLCDPADRRTGQNINPDDMRTAEKASAKYQTRSRAAHLSDEEAVQFKQAALETARCMRENGVKKFPDPTFDENGGAQIRMVKNMGIDPEDPAFQKAMKACEGTLPMGVQDGLGAGAVMKRALGGAACGGDRRVERSWRSAAANPPATAGAPRPRPARPPRWSEPTSSTARTCPARSATRTPARSPPASPARGPGLREPGAVVTPWHSLYSVDGAQLAAFLLYGVLPPWRDFASGVFDAEDVRQLERNLRAPRASSPWDGRRRLGTRRPPPP